MQIVLVVDRLPPFTGRDFHDGAVGGTQAAVVMLAEGLVALGHHAFVVTAMTTAVDWKGVTYGPRGALAQDMVDLLVLVREWSPSVRGITAARRVFYHTNIAPESSRDLFASARWADHLLFMSRYQQQRVEVEYVDEIGDVPHSVVDLATAVEDYESFDEDRPNRLVYCSVPDRGLVHLRKIFPAIRKSVPDAELVITSDFTLWGLASRRSEYERGFARIDGVRMVGAVPRPELVRIQRSSKVMAFPCHFEEGFCISAAECMAAGAVPVTTNNYALTTTVGAAGVLIDGRPGSRAYRNAYVAAVVALLADKEVWLSRAREARASALARFAPTVVARAFLTEALLRQAE